MDEYSCKARPYSSLLPFFPSVHSSNYLNEQTTSSDDIYFNILFVYTTIFVPTDGTGSFGKDLRHALYNVSMEQMMQETIFLSWFSKLNVPNKDAFRLVYEEILRCANDMVYEDEEDLNVFTIRVDLVVTTPLEDDSCDDEGDYNDEVNNCLDEDEEKMEVEEEEEEEEDNGLIPPITRVIEGESYEVDHEDNYGYDGNDGLYEDEEEMEFEEEEEDNELVHDILRAIEGDNYEFDHEDNYSYEGNNDLEEDEEDMLVEEEYIRFIPAAKSCIEELEMVEVAEVSKCVICLEDFNIGVRLPCSHMFHANCIHDWLVVGNACPLCRFELPTANTSE